jgi:hypothetical protein
MTLPTITIEVSDADLANLHELVQRCAEADTERDGATSHGALADPAQLLAMLAEDAAMVIRRPGAWEGAGMAQLLASHGYEV